MSNPDAIEKKPDKYRFDDHFENVYEYDGKSYVFIGSYIQYKIKEKMKEGTKIKLVEDYSEW